jgi:hypothetical protein
MRVVGGGELPYWFLNIEAWVALLSVIGLAGVLLVHLLINPTLSDEMQVRIPTFEAGLAAIIGFYFGARA